MRVVGRTFWRMWRRGDWIPFCSTPVMGKGRGADFMCITWSMHGTGARQQKGFITQQFILLVTNRGFIQYAGFFNTSSCWLYSCLHWIKDCLGQSRWDTKKTGKELPANTVHPLSVKVPTVPKSGCCTDRNKPVCAWKCLHGLCSATKTCWVLSFFVIFALYWDHLCFL